jgi:hypothetical protein
MTSQHNQRIAAPAGEAPGLRSVPPRRAATGTHPPRPTPRRPAAGSDLIAPRPAPASEESHVSPNEAYAFVGANGWVLVGVIPKSIARPITRGTHFLSGGGS